MKVVNKNINKNENVKNLGMEKSKNHKNSF